MDNHLEMTFGSKLRYVCGIVRWSVRQAAEAAGVPVSSLQTVVQEDRDPKAAVAFKVSRALNVPLDWMCDPDSEIADFHALVAARRGANVDPEEVIRREFLKVQQELAEAASRPAKRKAR